ncbi:MAG: nickel/cobalt efflux transporter [Pseudomonadota bacterium]
MNLTSMIENGANNPVLLFATALLLGGLHGLEPGHSKTMISAYIIAIRGTVSQAVLLGVAATISHSIIVWVLAFMALTWGNDLIGEQLEPWLLIASGIIVLGIALWMFWQMRQSVAHHHEHHHHHHHHHHSDGVDQAHAHHQQVTHRQGHAAEDKAGHDEHTHDPVAYAHLDAHARAHAREIEERLSGGKTSTWQTILFGLSGGLIPCPAAITVFLLCLHLDRFALGVTLVTAFSIGLALTMVAVGAAAAVGLKALNRRTSRLDQLFKAAPYASSVIIAVIGCVMLYSGWSHLEHTHA